MASDKLKYSLGIAAVVALALVGYSFFAGPTQTAQAPQIVIPSDIAVLEIEPGDGSKRMVELAIDGKTSLFASMEKALAYEGIAFDHKNYSTMGELVTQIGLKKNGEDKKYWQFWVNGEYSKVGVSEYIVKVGDIIRWKFTDESEQK